MSQAFKRLEKVLKLEADQGYQNKAVIGGIRQFATYWVEQARQEAAGEAERALVEQTADVLMDYGRLPGLEARAKAIDGLLATLAQRPEAVSSQQSAVSSRQAAGRQPTTRDQGSRTNERGSPPSAVPASSLIPQPPPPSPQPPAPKARPKMEPDPAALAQSVTAIKGVGPKMAGLLARLEATTVEELLYVLPRRYDDYTQLKPISRLAYGEQVTVIGTIWETRAQRRPHHTRVQTIVSDGTSTMQVTWFNQPWLTEKLRAGMQIVLSGKVEQFMGRPVMNRPEWEPLEWDPLRTRRIVPVYPLTQGLTSNKMREIMREAVERFADLTSDPVPDEILQRRRLLPLPEALRQVHFPDSQELLHQGRKRLAFDELFLLQLGMLGQRREWQGQPAVPIATGQSSDVWEKSELLTPFNEKLPFELTGAQQRVMAEIAADLGRDVPMNRLLQGDVGAGKTVVAAAAMWLAAGAGAQAALMAPTEILAEQHGRTLGQLLAEMGMAVKVLTGSTPSAEKERIYAALTNGEAQVVVGTHALIQAAVAFKRLALVVIDEQHRFGVDQRQALRQKGLASTNSQYSPHLLVMTATPIPRTLALSLFGDLDLSVLDEMPPGRQAIKTKWLEPSRRQSAYSFVRRQVGEGRQAFIICPLVEESDKVDAAAAVAEYERLQKEIFPELRLGLAHGRLKADEKEAAMRAFYGGETDVLVATSVIEVGIDVPNASVMVIEGADRFGLAQLHQFRGRVGRGAHQSYCILLTDSANGGAGERLQAMEQTNDGFVLAEKDLELRGPGEFLGRRQSGLPELRLASISDLSSVTAAREEAQAVMAQDPLLARPEHAFLRQRVLNFWERAGDVS